jgi:hypothetical protein
MMYHCTNGVHKRPFNGGPHPQAALSVGRDCPIDFRYSSSGAGAVPMSAAVTHLHYPAATVPEFPVSTNTGAPTRCELEVETPFFDPAHGVEIPMARFEKEEEERRSRLSEIRKENEIYLSRLRNIEQTRCELEVETTFFEPAHGVEIPMDRFENEEEERRSRLSQIRKENEIYLSRLRNIEQSFFEDREAAAEFRGSLDSVKKQVHENRQARLLLHRGLAALCQTHRDLISRGRRHAQNRRENDARLERISRGVHVLRLNIRCLKNVFLPDIQRRPREASLVKKHRAGHHRRCSMKAKNAARHRYPGWDSYRPYYGAAITDSEYNSRSQSQRRHDWS